MKPNRSFWTGCLAAVALSVAATAEELSIPFASFESGVERLEFWKPYRFGQGSSFERIHTTKIARTGTQALALSVGSSGGGQGVLVDVPVQRVIAGSEITFGAQVRLEEADDLASGSVNLHVELMAGSKSILRTDQIGAALAVNATNATTAFHDVLFQYRVDPVHLTSGRKLEEVTAVRLVIVALQPVVPGPQQNLGTLFIDDVVAAVKMP